MDRLPLVSVLSLLLTTQLVVAQQRICCECKNPAAADKADAPAGFRPKHVSPSASRPGGEGTKEATAEGCFDPKPPQQLQSEPISLQELNEELKEHLKTSMTHQRSDIWLNAGTPAGAERLPIILSDAQPSANQEGKYTVISYASIADLVAASPALQKAVHEICSLGEEGKLAAHMKYVCFGKNGFWEVRPDFGGHW